MASRKLTITLDAAQGDHVRTLVSAGGAASVAEFVEHAVAVALEDVCEWDALLTDALRATGGPMTNAERAWADRILGGSS